MAASLPFGLRSAPMIFSVAADALLWIIAQQGVQVAIHYLDEFLFVGSPAWTAAAMPSPKPLTPATA